MLANAGSDTSVSVNTVFNSSTQVMSPGIPPSLMSLLLFSWIIRASLISADQSYEVAFPCDEGLVCFHMRRLGVGSSSDYIAVATNGQIRPRSETPGCSEPIPDQTDGTLRFCHGTEVPSPQRDITEINLIPGKSASLQCLLLPVGRAGSCRWVRLRWLDQADIEIQDDAEHQIRRDSNCNVTLTVNFKTPGIKTLKCQAVKGSVRTSVELRVKVPAFKGKGRVLIVEPEPGPEEKLPETGQYYQYQGGKLDIVGMATGLAGCAILVASVAAFVVRRKRGRTGNQRPPQSESSSSNNGSDPSDVIYADIVLPDGSGQVLVDAEDTEYACIRHK